MVSERLIVGLGNPEEKYTNTRHNLGFLVVQSLADKSFLKFKKNSQCQGLVAKGEIEKKRVILLMPQTYMNQSGVAVRHMMNYFKINIEDLLIVLDDLNLEFGQSRLKVKGTAGGHNGLASIMRELASEDFARLRLGIGAPSLLEGKEDYVLSSFSPEEKKQLHQLIEQSVDCCRCWLTQGIHNAMNQYNRRDAYEK